MRRDLWPALLTALLLAIVLASGACTTDPSTAPDIVIVIEEEPEGGDAGDRGGEDPGDPPDGPADPPDGPGDPPDGPGDPPDEGGGIDPPPAGDFPSGRMLGTLYYGDPLPWQDLDVLAEILELDFLILGDRLRSNPAYAGFAGTLHAEKPSFKVIEYFSFPWMWDICHDWQDPGRVPCTEYGRKLYDAFHPQDIAHIVPVNPDPAVADTAFHSSGFYMIDLDNPGVTERIAEIIHEHVMTGHNPDIDGVFLDWFQARWGGWCLYGNSPGQRGYDGTEYWLDYDGDGIPVNEDPDEAEKVHDAHARLIDRLHELFGPEFLVISNGSDGYAGGEMSDGSDMADRLDGALTEQFPWNWTPTDYFRAAFGVEGSRRADGQDAWEIADRGTNNPLIPTPQGNYWFMDTFNEQNNPWICIAALFFDNAVACVSGNPDNYRDEWVGGDPLPRLEELGAPLGPPTLDGPRLERAFTGGTVVCEFSNSPAELVVEPWTNGRINAPDGPFKYAVLGPAPGDTIYAGGGW